MLSRNLYIMKSMKFIERIKNLFRKEGKISDGYHTFDDLYDFRALYNAAFFNSLNGKYNVHKSRRHSNGEFCFDGGWFIVMADLPTGQISNHYEDRYWNLFNIPEKEKADKWDGHSDVDVQNRLYNFNMFRVNSTHD